MKKSLLIISCSKSKIKTTGVLPAYKRYSKGRVYQSLCRSKNEGYFPKNLDILIISAEYGLLKWDEPIECYNQKMSIPQARKLRPSIQEGLESFLDGKDYDQLFINLGKEYCETLRGFDFEKYIKVVSKPEKIEGKHYGGGEKNSQMIKWLKELSKKESA